MSSCCISLDAFLRSVSKFNARMFVYIDGVRCWSILNEILRPLFKIVGTNWKQLKKWMKFDFIGKMSWKFVQWTKIERTFDEFNNRNYVALCKINCNWFASVWWFMIHLDCTGIVYEFCSVICQYFRQKFGIRNPFFFMFICSRFVCTPSATTLPSMEKMDGNTDDSLHVCCVFIHILSRSIYIPRIGCTTMCRVFNKPKH